MGQTSSTGQVDYTFGLMATKTNSPYGNKEENNIDITFSTTSNKRLLQYPQQYGLENDSSATGYDSDDELVDSPDNRFSIPSASSDCSLPFSYQPHSPFYLRTSTSSFQQQDEKQTMDRIDSGYADQTVFGPKKEASSRTSLINSRLANDVRYVDQRYYTTNAINKKGRDYHHHEFNLFISANSNTTLGTLDLTTDTLDDGAEHRDDDITIDTKLTFAAAALASQDPSMRDICLSRRSLIHLSPNIGLLTSIRKLNLCNNMLIELPDSIGQLQQLEVLLLSKNKLQHLPDSIQHLPRLTELDLSYNQLSHLPSLGHLTSLCTLLLSHNNLTRLPSDLIGMKRLVTMDLTNNPLPVLPAEITRLSNLRRLRLDHCHKLLSLNEHVQMEVDLTHDPPSLKEICARKALVLLSSSSNVNNNNSKLVNTARQHSVTTTKLERLTGHLIPYLASANTCSSCHGPYFESHVIRRRLIEKNDLWIPLEYTLCSAHWSDEKDRLLNMFHRETLLSNSNSDMINAIASLHTLASQQQQDQQQQQQPSPSTSLYMNMDELEAKSTGKMVFLRHPQRLQRVRNKHPSSFLIPKIHRG
ncbi:hypothetical protein BCR42DRAFT_421793 [Absidia repens]|uniref:L domain-like protein n=1 Tax=Absidia repens TaxID=90262 RepID=A0A1X2I9G6_9FUNG|nr:hypothetical protein BCR42DRAFT_421793 [Absidia repens]